LIGLRSIIRGGTAVQDTVMMGADYYEGSEERAENLRVGRPEIGIGAGSELREAIIDKNARIGENCRLLNREGVQEADGSCYFIRDGILVIPKNGVVPAGTEV
jgi:glucose-1-phosphate adenylyltransferase